MKRREILKGLSIIPLAGVASAAIAKHQAGTDAEPAAAAAEEWLPKKELIKTTPIMTEQSSHSPMRPVNAPAPSKTRISGWLS